jgi:PST family polysaccharide transporter
MGVGRADEEPRTGLSTQAPSSHRQILRATSIMGGSSVLNVIVGLVRFKVAALLLGTVGVGLAGLLQNIMSTASSVAALGTATAGTRQIAEANARADGSLATARRALFVGTAALALLGGLIFWLLRKPLADLMLQQDPMAATIGYLAFGVALTVLAGAQTALLTGLRRLGDVAAATVLSSLLGSAAGIAALFLFGMSGIVWFVVAMPAATVLVGAAFVLRVPPAVGPRGGWRELAAQWPPLARLGIAFSAAGLIALGAQLVVRIMIQRELGNGALGLFQASWTIAMTYVVFVLQAMGTDYYPRLTASIPDPAAASKLVNEQTEVALWLGGPVLLAIMGMAPWLMKLLYSSAFTGAAELLRWQVLGDVLKLAGWPLGFVVLASGKGRAYLLAESIGAVTLVGGTWLGLAAFHLEAAGIGYCAMYLIYLPIVFIFARTTIAFSWTSRVLRLLAAVMAGAVLIMMVSAAQPQVGALLGLVLAAALAVAAVVVMRDSLPAPVAHAVAAFRRN